MPIKKERLLDRSQVLVVIINALVVIFCFFLNYFLVVEKSLEQEISSLKGKIVYDQWHHLSEIQQLIILGRQEGNLDIPGTYLITTTSFPQYT